MKILYKVKAGSHLHGLQTENSDEDYLGVFLEKKENILHDYLFDTNLGGREIDRSVFSKNEHGGNNPDAIDEKYFSLKKFIVKALNNNPTIIEILFAPKENIVYMDDLFKPIYENRQLFLSRIIYYQYVDYAISQQKKATIKEKTYDNLMKTLEFLKENLEENKNITLFELQQVYKKNNESQKINCVLENCPNAIHIKISGTDYKLERNLSIKRAIKKINEILKGRTHRDELRKNKSYDTKFISHTYRLLCQGYDILFGSGTIVLPLPEKDRLDILNIKLGNYSFEKAQELIEAKKEKFLFDFKNNKNKIKVPELPNSEKIWELVKEVYRNEIFK